MSAMAPRRVPGDQASDPLVVGLVIILLVTVALLGTLAPAMAGLVAAAVGIGVTVLMRGTRDDGSSRQQRRSS
jgi:hypothetical protein